MLGVLQVPVLEVLPVLGVLQVPVLQVLPVLGVLQVPVLQLLPALVVLQVPKVPRPQVEDAATRIRMRGRAAAAYAARGGAPV